MTSASSSTGPRDTVSVVPIPPVLVALLRDHIERFGTAADGRLFQVTWGQRGKGGVVSTKVYGPAWQKAHSVALTKAQQASPLAGRPYDVRHGGVTVALNAGVPVRAENIVQVMRPADFRGSAQRPGRAFRRGSAQDRSVRVALSAARRRAGIDAAGADYGGSRNRLGAAADGPGSR